MTEGMDKEFYIARLRYVSGLYWVDSCYGWGLTVHAQPSGLPALLRVGLSLHSDGSTHDLTPKPALFLNKLNLILDKIDNCTFLNKLNLILDKINNCTFCGAY